MALSDIRRKDWQRSRAHAYWVALLGRVKRLPKFEAWVDPDQGVQSATGRRAGSQNREQMKNAIFQLAKRTGTQVTQGDQVLIRAKTTAL